MALCQTPLRFKVRSVAIPRQIHSACNTTKTCQVLTRYRSPRLQSNRRVYLDAEGVRPPTTLSVRYEEIEHRLWEEERATNRSADRKNSKPSSDSKQKTVKMEVEPMVEFLFPFLTRSPGLPEPCRGFREFPEEAGLLEQDEDGRQENQADDEGPVVSGEEIGRDR